MKPRNSNSEDFSQKEKHEANAYPHQFPEMLTTIMHEAFGLCVIENNKADLINLIINPAEQIQVFIEAPESLNGNLTRGNTGLLAKQPDILTKRKRAKQLEELIKSKEYKALLTSVSELKKKHPEWLYHLDLIHLGRENRLAKIFLQESFYS